jgi:hypothetical protein
MVSLQTEPGALREWVPQRWRAYGVAICRILNDVKAKYFHRRREPLREDRVYVERHFSDSHRFQFGVMLKPSHSLQSLTAKNSQRTNFFASRSEANAL